ncbi:hypothetical protein MRX96_031346 [Rhipicephalus microplus]
MYMEEMKRFWEDISSDSGEEGDENTEGQKTIQETKSETERPVTEEVFRHSGFTGVNQEHSASSYRPGDKPAENEADTTPVPRRVLPDKPSTSNFASPNESGGSGLETLLYAIDLITSKTSPYMYTGPQHDTPDFCSGSKPRHNVTQRTSVSTKATALNHEMFPTAELPHQRHQESSNDNVLTARHHSGYAVGQGMQSFQSLAREFHDQQHFRFPTDSPVKITGLSSSGPTVRLRTARGSPIWQPPRSYSNPQATRRQKDIAAPSEKPSIGTLSPQQKPDEGITFVARNNVFDPGRSGRKRALPSSDRGSISAAKKGSVSVRPRSSAQSTAPVSTVTVEAAPKFTLPNLPPSTTVAKKAELPNADYSSLLLGLSSLHISQPDPQGTRERTASSVADTASTISEIVEMLQICKALSSQSMKSVFERVLRMIKFLDDRDQLCLRARSTAPSPHSTTVVPHESTSPHKPLLTAPALQREAHVSSPLQTVLQSPVSRFSKIITLLEEFRSREEMMCDTFFESALSLLEGLEVCNEEHHLAGSTAASSYHMAQGTPQISPPNEPTPTTMPQQAEKMQARYTPHVLRIAPTRSIETDPPSSSFTGQYRSGPSVMQPVLTSIPSLIMGAMQEYRCREVNIRQVLLELLECLRPLKDSLEDHNPDRSRVMPNPNRTENRSGPPLTESEERRIISQAVNILRGTQLKSRKARPSQRQPMGEQQSVMVRENKPMASESAISSMEQDCLIPQTDVSSKKERRAEDHPSTE